MLFWEVIMAFEIFISYSHKDRELRDKLATALSNLRNQKLIRDWHDRDISPGSEWKKEILSHLDRAQIILLLISPDGAGGPASGGGAGKVGGCPGRTG